MPTIDIDDVSIHYERRGNGPSVLFIHGLTGDASSFAEQARRLSDRYDCVVYDRRGHARSTWGDAEIDDQRHADDAAALIEALGLAPCLVVGSSLGARITIDLARRHGHLLRGMVLGEPPLFSIDPDAAADAMPRIVPLVEQAVASGDRRGFVDTFLSMVCPGLWSGIDEATRDRYRANADVALVDLQSSPPDVSAEDLAAIAVPALVIAGDTSPAFHLSICQRLIAGLADARLLELEDCGHVHYFEQPDQYERAVATFAEELDRRRAAATP